MRLETIAPNQLSPEQKALYERNREQIAHGFTSFKTMRDDGALLGPWGVFLHEPSVGQAHYDQISAISALKRLPEPAKQVAILVTGARYKAEYELYAHAAIAASEGLEADTIATIAAGQRPTALTPDEAMAYDVADALVAGGALNDALYGAARDHFGEGALMELVLWVATYAQVSIVLNAFDVPREP